MERRLGPALGAAPDPSVLQLPARSRAWDLALPCCSHCPWGLWPLSPWLFPTPREREGQGHCPCFPLQLGGFSAFQGRKSAFLVFHFTAGFFVGEFQKCTAEPMPSLRQYVSVIYSKSMCRCLQGPMTLEVYFINSVYISVSLNRVKAYHH